MQDSLDFYVQFACKITVEGGGIGWRSPLQVHYMLHGNLPEIYDDSHWDRDDLGSEMPFSGIQELLQEIHCHGKARNIRVTTSLDADVQTLEFAWDGPALSAEVIAKINANYQRGATLPSRPFQSGTLRAGYFLRHFATSIRIENHQDGEYNVRNIVELPLHYR